jgi:hypothetical protein
LFLVVQAAGSRVTVLTVAGEVIGAKVMEAGVGVSEQVPDDHQHGAADGDDRLLLAATSREPAVSLTEEGVAASSHHRSLTQHPRQVAVAVSGGPTALGLAGR